MTRKRGVSPLPSHEEMVANILAVYDRASQQQVTDGKLWYGRARRVVDAIAKAADTDPGRVANVLAALSPRNPWRWNVADAYSYITASQAGMPRPSATTFKSNQRAAWSACRDGVIWSSLAPKVKSFVGCILGNTFWVVVDVWAVRIATGGRLSAFPPCDYDAIADAYREAADEHDLAPHAMQAITWLVAQGEGLGSGRRGRHDQGFKKGTPTFVQTLAGL